MIRPAIDRCLACFLPVVRNELVVTEFILSSERSRNIRPTLASLLLALQGAEFGVVHASCMSRPPPLLGNQGALVEAVRCACCLSRIKNGDVLAQPFRVGDVVQLSPKLPGPHLGLDVSRPRWAHIRCADPRLKGLPFAPWSCGACQTPLHAGQRAVLGCRVVVPERLGEVEVPQDLVATLVHARCEFRRGPLFT